MGVNGQVEVLRLHLGDPEVAGCDARICGEPVGGLEKGRYFGPGWGSVGHL